MEKPIILWGATGQSKVLRECVERSGSRLEAVFDNNRNVRPPFNDIPLYFGNEGLHSWLEENGYKRCFFLVAIGGDKGRARLDIQDYLENQGLEPMTAVHNTAFVADSAVIGRGSQILAKSAVCVEAEIGRGCIVNTGATVDHESILGDGTHVCPGANVAGCVEIEECATIGTGAVILPRIKVGRGAVVGAGAVVTKHVEPYTVVAGNPAKLLRRL